MGYKKPQDSQLADGCRGSCGSGSGRFQIYWFCCSCSNYILCRMIGAGDIKVMALIVGFLGPFQGADVLAAGFCIGAAVSLFKLLRRGILQQRLIYFMVYIRHLFQTKQITAYFKPERDGYDVTIPFVACLFLGTIISWWWK